MKDGYYSRKYGKSGSFSACTVLMLSQLMKCFFFKSGACSIAPARRDNWTNSVECVWTHGTWGKMDFRQPEGKMPVLILVECCQN